MQSSDLPPPPVLRENVRAGRWTPCRLRLTVVDAGYAMRYTWPGSPPSPGAVADEWQNHRTASFGLASSVLAQYRFGSRKSVVRGRGAPGSRALLLRNVLDDFDADSAGPSPMPP